MRFFLFFTLLVLLQTNSEVSGQTSTYTDNEIVSAIYKAEGGVNAKHPYGICSVKYKNRGEARRICLNTVKKNRKRYEAYGHKSHGNFISFLGSRYCPTQGKLSNAERRLNVNWVRNVNKILISLSNQAY